MYTVRRVISRDMQLSGRFQASRPCGAPARCWSKVLGTEGETRRHRLNALESMRVQLVPF